MQKISQIIENIANNVASYEAISTGFDTIDRRLDGGFMRKELVVIGGHTGFGKSYLAGQILLNVAQNRYKTAYFSLEISNEMVVSRMIGSLANINPTRLRTGLLKLDELQAKRTAETELMICQDDMSFYDDQYELEPIKEEIRSNSYDFVVIDFIQNMLGKGQDEYSRLSNISLELQRLAKETNSCILVISQLSNSVARERVGSSVVEYKGSGGIATACDLGFFIGRGEYVIGSPSQDLRLNLRKNRRGISGIYFDLVFTYPGGAIKEKEELPPPQVKL